MCSLPIPYYIISLGLHRSFYHYDIFLIIPVMWYTLCCATSHQRNLVIQYHNLHILGALPFYYTCFVFGMCVYFWVTLTDFVCMTCFRFFYLSWFVISFPTLKFILPCYHSITCLLFDNVILTFCCCWHRPHPEPRYPVNCHLKKVFHKNIIPQPEFSNHFCICLGR